ncbi:nucleoside hydrolase [Paenibacillus glycanilyticus]|uniref:nucleoside hydrolase n=1 Tax=Paenibacillus glycanilyticus TaxID=126569 RepID=UPI00203CDABD|nr:nucleoside hydrolase [Paenibacillus glycanilyticus]MCM3625792.1 nucleoside hydrolase [Paenibacillus glycanilyticus]
MNGKTRIILDVDTGIDDALAVLYALLSPDIHVEGLTTGFGNIHVEQATENTLRLIKLANCGYEVPVAAGAAGPLQRDYAGPVPHIHGHNGIGDAKLAPTEQQPLKESAAEFIVRKAHELPGELVVVTVGRMTNLALAVAMDPSIASKIRNVVVMGGTVFAPGNVTPVSEANLWGDPEAAQQVFRSELPLTIVGLDVTLQTRLSRTHLDQLRRLAPEDKQPIVDFLHTALEKYFTFYLEQNQYLGECPMHDPLAVLVAVNPSLVNTRVMRADIDCGHGLTAGMIITDRRVNPQVGREITFCLEVDADQALRQMLSVFLAP